MSASVPIRWTPRADPLPALAVAGVGPVALALLRRVLAEDDAGLARWRGVAGSGVLVLLGDAASLPWVEGVVYLGRELQAPSLLLPCTLAPDVPLALLERAFSSRYRGMTPLAVLPRSGHLVPVGAAQPLFREALEALRLEEAPP